MTGSVVLDVALGLSFTFLVFSVASSKVNEFVLGLFNYRATTLEAALKRLMTGDGAQSRAFDEIYGRLTGALGAARDRVRSGPDTAEPRRLPMRKEARKPSYVSSRSFVRAILGMLAPQDESLRALRQGRSLLAQIRADLLPEPARELYKQAVAGLTPMTAQALLGAVPADDPSHDEVAAVARAVGPDLVTQLTEGIRDLPASSPLRTALDGAISRAGTDRDALQQDLEQWYDEAMDRLSGWYKRRVQLFLLIYATGFTLLFNVDAISLTRVLWQDDAVRAAVVAEAERQVSTPSPAVSGTSGSTPTPTATPPTPGPSTPASPSTSPSSAPPLDVAADKIRTARSLGLPFGWVFERQQGQNADPRAFPADVRGWILKIVGLVATIGALSFGATFWFDMLGRLVNMRNTGPKPQPTDGR